MKVKRKLISLEIQNPLFIGGYLTLDNMELGYIKGNSSILLEDIEAGIYTLSFFGEKFTLKNSLNAREGTVHKIHLAHDFEETELGYRFSEISALVENHTDFTRLKELVSIPVILERKSFETGKTILHMAVDSLYYEGVKLLLEAGAAPDCTDKLGSTPLMSAVEKSDISIVKLLLERGADVNTFDCNNENALMRGITSHKNTKEIIDLLVEKNIDMDLVSKRSGLTPLLKALGNKDFSDLFHLLLEKSDASSLTLRDSRGYSALDLALAGGDIRSIETVIARGILPCSQPSIYKAISTKNKEIITYTLNHLLKNGMDIDTAGSEGLTPLMFACSIHYLEAVDLLLDMGASINKRDLWGDTALYYSLHSPEICSCLMENGADTDITNLKGETPLMKLIPEKFQNTAKLFIK